MNNIKKFYKSYMAMKNKALRQTYELAAFDKLYGCIKKTKKHGGEEYDMNLEDMSLEQLAETQEKHRQQMDANREKARLRKERTHRLIVIGSVLAKYIPELTDMSDDDIRMRVTDIARDAKTD